MIHSAVCALVVACCRLHPNPKVRERNLAQKFRKWWVQSFLAAVPTIVVGGRDDTGKLIQVCEHCLGTALTCCAAVGMSLPVVSISSQDELFTTPRLCLESDAPEDCTSYFT